MEMTKCYFYDVCYVALNTLVLGSQAESLQIYCKKNPVGDDFRKMMWELHVKYCCKNSKDISNVNKKICDVLLC